MQGNLFTGISHLFVGARLLTKPGIRGYVFIPLLINVVLFSLAIYALGAYFDGWMVSLTAWLPEWLGFVESILWFIFGLLLLVMVAFTFTLVANLIGAPFNGLLAEAVERHLTGNENTGSSRSLLAEVPHSLGRECAKLGYYLPRVLGLVILGFIPLLNTFAPFMWAIFGVWMMAMQYLDYPMDNHDLDFKEMRQQIRGRRLTTLGFGGITLVATMLPLVNLIVMPAAVAGAAALWLEDYQGRA